MRIETVTNTRVIITVENEEIDYLLKVLITASPRVTLHGEAFGDKDVAIKCGNLNETLMLHLSHAMQRNTQGKEQQTHD